MTMSIILELASKTLVNVSLPSTSGAFQDAYHVASAINQGNMTGKYLLEAECENPGIVVPMGQWHKLECLESGTVILESKDGAYEPLTEEEILNI